MTAKELIKALLEMPDLDMPVVLQSQNSGYKFTLHDVQAELDGGDNWIIQINESTEIYLPEMHPHAEMTPESQWELTEPDVETAQRLNQPDA